MPDQLPPPKPPGTLRDWFAGVAICASEVTLEREDGGFYFTAEQLSKRAYAIADAMIRERAK